MRNSSSHCVVFGFTCLLLAAFFCATVRAEGPAVSIITDADAGAPAAYGVGEILGALTSRQTPFEQVASPQAARGGSLLIAGRAANLTAPSAPESLLIHRATIGGKPALLLAGADDVGLMYAALDVADRIAWAAEPAHPFSEVHDVAESPDVRERAVSIYTMNRAYFESRLYDERYWSRYFDTLARNRFNGFTLIFGYENGGFLAPPYPYFFDTEGFDSVRMVGLTAEQQRKNLDALNRLIRLAHDRGIKVTLGIWDHIYRGGVQANGAPGSENALKQPTPNLVWGVTADNLVPYTKAALAKLLRFVPAVDGLQFRMHDESGLKNSEQAAFWADVFKTMKQQHPALRLDLRAKGLPDGVIDNAVQLGVNFRIDTKVWMEQMGLPFHPAHINRENQQDRRHSYADLLRYPKQYPMFWRLWNGGTARVLLWGDPDYARRFATASHLYDGDGFEICEPLCTKMQAQAQDAAPFELLKPAYRYTDYEFERYWHFFQVFGRLAYNPNTPREVWEREFQRRFGSEAGLHVQRALERASRVLPRIVAACYPYSDFPMTRGWAEKMPLGDLPHYAAAEGSDIAQFASFDEEARVLLEGLETAKVRPPQTAWWFEQTSREILSELASAEQAIGDRKSKEFASTAVDLKILAHLGEFHARRIPAAVAWRLYERTSGDPRALDAAITHEREAVEAWKQLVAAAGDTYADDLMMGNRKAGLCGHWRDELPALQKGLADLERRRAQPHSGEHPTTAPAQLLADDFAGGAAAPQVRHAPVTQAPFAQPLTLTATISSPAGIKWARVRYRPVNQRLDYATIPLLPTAKEGEYQATIPAEALSTRWDLMYYLEALDARGHGRIWPDLETETPYVVVKLSR